MLNKDITTCRTSTITGTLKRPSLPDEEKLKLSHQKGSSNFNSLPANVSKMHLQGSPHYLGAINLNEFSNHSLTLKKDKNQPPKSIYICDGDIFKKLDSELSRAQEQTLDTSYVILPTNTSTLRAKPKDESKYSINIDQMPQTRLIHLSMATDPGFVVKSPPREPVSMACSEVQGSSMIQQQQQLAPQSISNESQIPNSLCDTGDSGNSGVVSKSETVSTLSMSSLEVSGVLSFLQCSQPRVVFCPQSSHSRGVGRKNLGENATQDAMPVSCYPEGLLACDHILEWDVTTSRAHSIAGSTVFSPTGVAK